MARTPVSLRGDVRRITFRNDDNHYTVIKLHADEETAGSIPSAATLFGPPGEVTVVGYFPSIAPGEWIELSGTWVDHPEFGRQFRADTHRKVPPATEQGIERYLGSGAVDGIGPTLARRLVQRFGARTLDVIDKEPERLFEVEGIGKKKQASIVEAFRREEKTRDTLVFLQSYGIAAGTAGKIVRQYGEETMARVREDPYRLADEVFGIGFKTADRIASEMGIEEDSLLRGRAAISYIVNQNNAAGHVFVPLSALMDEAEGMGLSASTCRRAVDDLHAANAIVVEPMDGDSAIYPSFLHFAEVEVAGRLSRMSQAAAEDLPTALPRDVLTGLTKEQRTAVTEAVRPGSGLLVITGGPGTGKTTTLRAIVGALDVFGIQYMMAAPTGRAAKRMQETTGRDARTIHRLLEYSGGAGTSPRFQKNQHAPVEADVVIVDEASMIDLPLMFHLLRALKPAAKLILVGDADQLPSVGPGNVFRDVLAGPSVRSIRLTQVFRQAESSRIVVNAHRIQRGKKPLWGGDDSDFFFMPVDTPQQAADLIVDLTARRLPRYLSCDPIHDIQVLAPQRRGPVGVGSLNAMLQDALNPERGGVDSVRLGAHTFRVGDRVMQMRNDYDKMVYNGDIGLIRAIDAQKEVLTVDFPDRDATGPVVYESGDVHQLALAYCTSVHKSQGSEYPAVVMPITWIMPALMNRNLLYTAVTRARRLVVLVGREDALAAYIRQARADERHTALAARLGAVGAAAADAVDADAASTPDAGAASDTRR